MGKGVLGGATYQLHKCLTNISPLLIFFLKYQLQNLKGSFWGGICLENVSSCFDPSLHYLCSKFEEQLS